MPLSRTAHATPPPVMEARRWLEGVTHPADRPLINVSQAAPVDPPPTEMRRFMADTLMNVAESHLYGPVLGLPELRTAVAARFSTGYGAQIAPEQVAITSGCNQAFAAAITAICDEGDEIILPTPWYFNHKMWLDMVGVRAVPLPTDAGLLPDPVAAKALITNKTRAIVLVTPNNPAGVEYPAGIVDAMADIAQAAGLRLIIDETYRDFDARPGPAHELFSRADWAETVIQLYSFSKAYRLTGHRVGAIVASAQLLSEVEKFLDTVTICPAQLGQHAALWGINNLDDWLAGERLEILDRRAAISDHFAPMAEQGWELMGLGAYFAYVRHPFAMASDALCQAMVAEAGVLALPGTMFRPEDDPSGAQELRIAYANIDRDGIAQLFARLAALGFPKRSA